MSNIEIEDVLSSIRRLVSDDVRSVQTRARGTADMPMPAAPTPGTGIGLPAQAADAGALADETVAEETVPDRDMPAVGPALVLTPAQRVPEADEREAQSLTGWDDDAALDRGGQVAERVAAYSSPAAGSLEQTISELEAAVAGIDGEFETDWGSAEDTEETAHDLEQVFRDPGLRDRLTLDEAAAGHAADDDDYGDDEGASDEAPGFTDDVNETLDADAADEWSEAADEADLAADGTDDGWTGSESDLDVLDQAIAGDAPTMDFGPASTISAAASASLAALIAAPVMTKPAGRLHFGSAPVAAKPEVTPVMPGPAQVDIAASAEPEPVAEMPAALAEVPDPVRELAAQAANVTTAPEQADRGTEAAVELAVAADAQPVSEEAPASDQVPASDELPVRDEVAVRHPRILRSSLAAEIDDEAAERDEAAGDQAGRDEAEDASDAEDSANLFDSEADQDIDIEALRDIVAEIIRQELQGVLGERITRSVRKLVRREINRVLETRTLE